MRGILWIHPQGIDSAADVIGTELSPSDHLAGSAWTRSRQAHHHRTPAKCVLISSARVTPVREQQRSLARLRIEMDGSVDHRGYRVRGRRDRTEQQPKDCVNEHRSHCHLPGSLQASNDVGGVSVAQVAWTVPPSRAFALLRCCCKNFSAVLIREQLPRCVQVLSLEQVRLAVMHAGSAMDMAERVKHRI